jgi:hypothetical protein
MGVESYCSTVGGPGRAWAGGGIQCDEDATGGAYRWLG